MISVLFSFSSGKLLGGGGTTFGSASSSPASAADLCACHPVQPEGPELDAKMQTRNRNNCT
eukprot:764251-Amphidinium_carterae.1